MSILFPRAFAYAAPFAVVAVVAGSTACERYVAPPEVVVVGAKDGVLTDVKAPLVLSFTKPVNRATLDVKIVPLDLDLEGNLPDERGEASEELKPLFSYTELETLGGESDVDPEDTRLVIRPKAPFPVGQKLAIVVEPGLATKDGVATTVRKRILFSYDFKCSGTSGTKVVPNGSYFALLDIEQPVPVQIQLWGRMEIDATNGNVRAQFTNADRNPALKCPTECAAEKACRLKPAPDCVVPSLKAGNVEEYSDFVPNVTPPTGYTVTINGCIEDQDADTAALVTAPANLVVQKPEVQVNGLILTASFKKDAQGIVRSTGTVTGSEIVFGIARLASGKGTASIRLVPESEAPKDIPPPPAAAPSRDQ
ncbi:MAG: hypothetical protein IPK71_27275 [Myxococcales bacterium]|nr:hypothetical protein [Myxococcales bacterium]